MTETNKKSLEERRLDVLEKILPDLEREATLEEIQEILDYTIKFDDSIKAIVFLACLVTFTEKEQVNIIMTGESSIGKTYCIKEILNYFPQGSGDDKVIIKKHGVTPTAFFYDDNRILVDKETLEPVVLVSPSKDSSPEEKQAYRELRKRCSMLQDFERKIVWLPDLPDVKVMERLRSILSHDDKLCVYSSTTPMKFGLQAKDTYLRGFGTFIICTSSAYLDEQETTRAFQLNPTWSKEKEKACRDLINKREASTEFEEELELNPKRVWLKERIKRIRDAKINGIFIPTELSERIDQWFSEKRIASTPKNSREYCRLRSLVKGSALFNLWTRKKDEQNNLYVNETDIEVAKIVYALVVESSAYNLSPEEYEFYNHLAKQYEETNLGISVMDAHNIFYRKNGRPCSDKRLRNMLASFCREGLMRLEKEGKGKFIYHIQQNKKEDKSKVEQKQFATEPHPLPPAKEDKKEGENQ